MKILTKEQVYRFILEGYYKEQDTVFEGEHLRYPFGFKRMSGEEIMLRKLACSQATEETMQIAPPFIVEENIKKWCRELDISYNYDFLRDMWTFRIKQPDLSYALSGI